MNYRLVVSGYRFDIYDDCVKLLIKSASESDYVIDITGYEKASPFSPDIVTIFLKGSAKEKYKKIIIDFDNVILNPVDYDIILSPKLFSIPALPNGQHYWGILGVLLKIIDDISPAYITGYLLENNLQKELWNFNSLANSAPDEIKELLVNNKQITL